MNTIGFKRPVYDTSPITYGDWVSSVESTLVESIIDVKSLCSTISIVIFANEASLVALQNTLSSIAKQCSKNWELFIFADVDIQHRLEVQDLPVTFLFEEKLRDQDKFICLNEVALQTQGDLITFLDAGDLVSKYFVSSIIHGYESDLCGKYKQGSNIKLIYTDEDYLSNESSGGLIDKRQNPCFKPDWNPDYLENYNYISKGVVYQRKYFNKIGGFNSDASSPFHDLVLRASNGLTASQIIHIPEVLFHFCLPIKDEKILRKQYTVEEPLPFVSIIIPTKDNLELLKPCVDGVLKNTEYKNLELIIIDNNSRDKNVLDYLVGLKADSRISVIDYKSVFNFSDMNNQAVKRAKGDIICFLNNDVSMLKKGWLFEMVSHANRTVIGCVGAKLYYPDGTIQHAGVILGLKGYASHAHKGFDGDSAGYFNRLIVTHNVSAVTAACLVVKKDIFYEVGGFDSENLKVAYNDVDFCLKVREAGYRNLFTPHAELIHHESKSRGKKRNKKDRQQLKQESDYLLKKWGDILFSDPAYNPNLTLLCEDFSLRLDRINADE